MNIYAEINIHSQHSTSHILETLREFSSGQVDWAYDEDRSAYYSSVLGDGLGCVLVLNDGKRSLGVSLSEKKERHMEVSNVTPDESGYISIAKYNEVVTLLYSAVKKWGAENHKGLALKISNTDLELDEILTAAIPRKLFESYLDNFPFSTHPNDARRLDRFICSISRYSRKSVNWDYLGEYLKEKRGWPVANVASCLSRISIGLDILRAYKES